MMKSAKILISILMVFFVLSCEQDIDLDLEIARKLVVLGSVSPDRPSEIRISTTGTSKDERISFPKNAIVRLTKGEKLIDELTYFDVDGDPRYISDQIISASDSYELNVQMAGFETVTAATMVPQRNSEINVNFSAPELLGTQQGVEFYESSVTIDPSPLIEQGGLYHASLLIEEIFEGNYYYYPYMIEEELPIFSYSEVPIKPLLHEDGFIFRGEDLTDLNDAFILRFDIRHNIQNVKGRIILDIRKVSQEYFDFHSSVADQEITNINSGLLSQSANSISNNIENGIGLFGAYTSQRFFYEW